MIKLKQNCIHVCAHLQFAYPEPNNSCVALIACRLSFVRAQSPAAIEKLQVASSYLEKLQVAKLDADWSTAQVVHCNLGQNHPFPSISPLPQQIRATLLSQLPVLYLYCTQSQRLQYRYVTLPHFGTQLHSYRLQHWQHHRSATFLITHDHCMILFQSGCGRG